MITDTVRFKEELEKINSWWVFNSVAELEGKPYIKREIFHKLLGEIGGNRIIVVTGPRRVGKTVLLKQVIGETLKKQNKENILYYSMDDPSLASFSNSLLKDLVDYFIENIAKEGRKYIFLDEVHQYKEWHKWIKSYYDRYSDIKFILSGSSSLALQKEANLFLKGRVISLTMFPLNFKEFLELSNVRLDHDFRIENLLKEEFKIKKTFHKIKPYFEEYLEVGGFPEWFEIKNKEKWFNRLIEDIPKKAVYEDISNIFGIKNAKILESIFTFIVTNQSKILSYEKINEIAGMDRNSLVQYIEYLKSSYLIIEILKYSKNVKEQLKSMKKYLCIDQGLRNAVLKDFNLNEKNKGFVIENVIGYYLFLKCANENKNLYYLREKEEVDFVIKNKDMTPVEVKYRNNINDSDLILIKKFIKEERLKKGVIITKNLLKKEKGLIFIPAWLFLLL